jgi:ThiF family protein
MPTTMVMRARARDWSALAAALPVGEDVVVESAVLGRGRLVEAHGRLVIVLDEVLPVADADCPLREAARLRVDDRRLMAVAAGVRGRGSFVLLAHSHPGGPGEFSFADDEHELDVARLVAGVAPGAALASVLRYSGGWRGRIVLGGERRDLDAVVVVGRPLQTHSLRTPTAAPTDGIRARQALALGPDHLLDVVRLRVGIVGAGGLGATLVDGAVRLGAGSTVLIDHDVLADSNLSRVINAGVTDVGKLKTDVATEALRKMFPDAEVLPVPLRTDDAAARTMLESCDILILATDNHTSRDEAWQVAHDVHAFVVSVGTDPQPGDAGVVARVSAYVADVGPEDGCLLCNGVIDAGRMRVEALPAETVANEVRDGYVRGVARPAVHAWNLVAAGEALGRLIELVAGVGPAADRGQVRQFELFGSADTRFRARAVCAPRAGCTCSRRPGHNAA